MSRTRSSGQIGSPLTATSTPPEKKLNRAAKEADLLAMSRTTLMYMYQHEGLPGYEVPGRGSRRIVLFDHPEVLEWLRGRRERQIAATLSGERYGRRRVVPVDRERS